MVPEEDDRYKGHLRLSDRGLWSPSGRGLVEGCEACVVVPEEMTV